jgi:IS5 family transposase
MNIRQGCVFSFEDAIKMQPRSRLEIILATLDFKVIFEALSKNNNDQHKGPNGYSLESKLNALIAMRVYNMDTFTELVERLTQDPVLRYQCGFEVLGKVPSIATFSQFYCRLTESGALHELFKQQVQQAESMGLLDTSSIAIDATKMDAHEKSVPSKKIKDDGQSANWGSKRDTDGNRIKWFGYKLHIATDVKSELPVALMATPASIHDGTMAEDILKECRNNLTSKPEYYLMDAGYDHKAIYEIVRKDYKAQAIIPLNHRRAKEPPEGLDWDATPICSADTVWYIGAAARESTSFVARILWANVIVPLVRPGAQTAIMEWSLKPGPDKIPGYLVPRTGVLLTGKVYTTREPV